MPKVSSEDIFILIHSLSKPEKRYFKFYASIGSSSKDNIYHRLFDVIESMKKYDEKKILKKIPEAKHQQLSNQKKYLRKLILESLRLYYSQGDLKSKLSSLISEIEILYEKRLLKLCVKQLKKAKQIAGHYEKYLEMEQLLALEENILSRIFSGEEHEKNSQKIYDARIQLNKEHGKTLEYLRMQNLSFKFFRRGALMMNREHFKELEAIMQNPLMANETVPTGFHQRLSYYIIYGNYHYAIALNTFNPVDWRNNYNSRKKTVEFIEQYPHQVAELPVRYLSVINNFLISCIHTREEEELEKCFGKIYFMLFGPDLVMDVLHQLLICSSTMLYYYVNSGKFAEGVALFEKMEGAYNKVSPNISAASRMSFHVTFSLLHFGEKNYKQSLFWLGKILNDKRSDARQDIQTFAHLFNLIIHFELNNGSELEYYTKATYRFLLTRYRMYKIETVVLKFIRKKMPKINSPQELKEAFKELSSELKELAKDPVERLVLGYFDFISWLESKIQNRPLNEVMRQKFLAIND